MKLILAICLLQVLLSLVAADQGPQYTVIAPGTIHSGKEYNVGVSIHHNTEPCHLKVGITGPSLNETKTVELQPDEVSMVNFQLPKLERGDYNLTAEGLDCHVFSNTTRLYWNEFVPHTRIQTDKGIYKPGDVINYRVIILDENLKPAQPLSGAVIYIEDDSRNRITEIKDFAAPHGVYTGKFQLSEFPVEGQWRISIDMGGNYPTTAYFNVKKYVLPKFNVQVEATEEVSVRDGDMQAVVRSNYTYGKPFAGKVTLVVSLNIYTDPTDKTKQAPPVIIKTTEMVNGKAKFDLNVKQYESFFENKLYAHSLLVTATVEEPFTDVKMNGTSYVSLYPYRYKMTCANYSECSQFTANEEQNATVLIRHVDNSIVENTKLPVKLIYKEVITKKHPWSSVWRDEKSTPPEEPKIEMSSHEFESFMNATGFATFKITLPNLEEFEHFNHYFEMRAEYTDEQRELLSTHQYRKPKQVDGADIPEQLPTEWFTTSIVRNQTSTSYSGKIGEPFKLMVNSSEPLDYLIMHMVARGNLLESKRLVIDPPSKIYNITITPTFVMSPTAAVYVYYVNKTGDYIFEEQSFYTEVELQNNITLSAPEEVKPGSEVTLKIKTETGSFVGLLAVDQSVLDLQDNNDLSMHDFQWSLGMYDTSTPAQGGYSRYPGDRSGMVTLTNANYLYNRTSPYVQFGPEQTVALERDSLLKTTTAAHAPPGAAGFGGAEMDVAQGGGAGGPDVRVRSDFSETWLFTDIEETNAPEFSWASKIPDTITKWVISGFSLHPEKGLGVTAEKSKVTTFQPFFVSIRLPYSVKRGEVIKVPALVFNYLNKALDVNITLDNTDGEYEFTDISNGILNENVRTEIIRVPANSAQGVAFMLRPKTIGNIMLKMSAISPVAGDAIHKTMKVVPEGITQYANRAYFVNLQDSGEFKEQFDLQLPEDVVPDSQHIELGVVGDLMGPLLNNMERLVRLPMGCGEQVSSAMAPNYMVMKYLMHTEQLKPYTKLSLERNLQTGHQNLLQYRNRDGSFCSFPVRSDAKPCNGSTWLTATVLKRLHDAGEFVNIDKKSLVRAAAYLAKMQADNGSFVEKDDGYFFRSQRNELVLTAAAVHALNANESIAQLYADAIKNGQQFLLDNWAGSNDTYAKIYSTYVLQKSKHPEAKQHAEKLQAEAKTENDLKWWTNDFTHLPSSALWWRWSSHNEIELTAYMLSILLDQGATQEQVFPIVRWLVAKRNNNGGFYSTQDTVVGVQSLIDFAIKTNYQPGIMDVDYTANDDKQSKGSLKLTQDNGLLYQTAELPQKSKGLEMHAKGKGAALMQVSYQYNIQEKEKTPSFTLESMVHKDTPAFKLMMQVCVDYVGEGDSSNMAILEVSLPSGYVADDSSFEDIKKLDRVREVETKNSDSVVVVYFERVVKGEKQCIPIEAIKTHAVALQKPSPIVVYDYYDTERKANDFYNVDSKLCDLCEEDQDCLDKCKEGQQ